MEAKQVSRHSGDYAGGNGLPPSLRRRREPYVRVAEIEIDPAHLEAYTAAVKEQIEAAIGMRRGYSGKPSLRHDPELALYSVADKDNPAHVFVFEMYADIDAYKAHLETAHFKKYKVATQDMVKSLKLRETIPILLGSKSR